MKILLVGLNHKTAPLEVRETISFPKEQLHDALQQLTERVGESVILSTCNRTEVYCTTENPAVTSEEIRRFLSGFHSLEADSVSPYLYDHADAEATRHLFEVASGLDSLIVGESQILGQVRDALTAASESHSLDVSLVGLFHAAVRTGRRVRQETDVGRNSLSISFAGVQLAQRVVGQLNGLRVLLIGAGEAGALVARALRTVGVGELTIANRTKSRGDELARSLGGETIPFDQVASALSVSDIVVAATEAPEVVVTADMVESAVSGSRERPLFIFDLAVPRDVDPRVGDLDNVRLFNIDDLSSIAEENLKQRKRAAAAAKAIVDDELARFMGWWESLDATPVIKTLRRQAEEIRERELERALHKMPDLSPDQLKVVEALTRSIVNRMLHGPTAFLKGQADTSQLETARDLFRLWDEPPAE